MLPDHKTKKELKTRLSETCTFGGASSKAWSPFPPSELDAQLRNLKSGKAPDQNNICAKQLGPGAKTTLLQLLNLSWTTGQLLSSWRRAVIIPIPKAGKGPKLTSSHRPIALTGHRAKLAERLVSARLTYIAERDGLIPFEQVGFRRGRLAEENLARIEQDGEKKKRSRAADRSTTKRPRSLPCSLLISPAPMM